MRTLVMRNVCLQTYRNNKTRLKVAYVLRKYGPITREFLGFRMRNIQDIIFI